MSTVPNLIHIKDWKNHHNVPSESMLRKLVFHEETNGFSYAVRRVGRKVYLDEEKVFEWIEQQNVR